MSFRPLTCAITLIFATLLIGCATVSDRTSRTTAVVVSDESAATSRPSTRSAELTAPPKLVAVTYTPPWSLGSRYELTETALRATQEQEQDFGVLITHRTYALPDDRLRRPLEAIELFATGTRRVHDLDRMQFLHTRDGAITLAYDDGTGAVLRAHRASSETLNGRSILMPATRPSTPLKTEVFTRNPRLYPPGTWIDRGDYLTRYAMLPLLTVHAPDATSPTVADWTYARLVWFEVLTVLKDTHVRVLEEGVVPEVTTDRWDHPDF